jgi:hypothetical protein
MIGDAVRKLVDDLNAKVPDSELGNPLLSSHSYKPYPLAARSFKTIRSVGSDRRVSFVDGGQGVLVEAPNFSVRVNRVYFNVFDGIVRVQPEFLPPKVEFFSLTFARVEGDDIFYDTLLFPVAEEFSEFLPDSKDLSFSSSDRRLRVGESTADIGRVASIARRFAEWEFCRNVVDKELDENDIVVMDGTLRTTFPNETRYAQASYRAAQKKSVVYSGLSKVSRLFTTTGLPLLSAIRRLATDNGMAAPWYYFPIADPLSPEHQGAIFAVRLHAQAPRVFRYEIHAELVKSLSEADVMEVFSQLSANSSDLAFPGYPYGLIDADYNSRVRLQELEPYRVILFSEMSKLREASKFLRDIQTVDAHQVLNSLREVPYV